MDNIYLLKKTTKFKLIGLPVFPPYWSLGFQQSRWGYDNLTHIKTIIDRTRAAKIPHVR
jgi:alpha-glucosidase (family GH31 glycosyl hydrolase)